MYGADPLGLLSWRFLVDEGGHGVSSDLLSHAVDLAHMLLGPIRAWSGTTETFISERPLPGGRRHALRPRARRATRPGPSRTRTTPGCCASSPRARAARSRPAARSSAPRARWRSTSTAPSGALRLEPRDAERAAGVRRRGRAAHRLPTVYGGDRYPYHGDFVPGSANGIGFEDLVVIEDYEFCRAVAEGRQHARASARRSTASASRPRCCARRESGRWEDVVLAAGGVMRGRETQPGVRGRDPATRPCGSG